MNKIITCNWCGTQLQLYSSWWNQCICGALYNSADQQIANPSQWGEETGESFGEDGSYVIGSGDQDAEYDPGVMSTATALDTQLTPAQKAAVGIVEELQDCSLANQAFFLDKLVSTYAEILANLDVPENELENTWVCDQLTIFRQALSEIDGEE